MRWTAFFRILNPDVKLAKKRFTIYKRLLKKIGVILQYRGDYKPQDCDFSQLRVEERGITLDEFIRNRSRYMRGVDWARKHGIPLFIYKKLIATGKLPYIRIGYRRTYVPADFDFASVMEEEVRRKYQEFEEEVRNLAAGRVIAIVFPNWKRYKQSFARRFIMEHLAMERRLLKVGYRYAVLVSATKKTLDELIAAEGGKIKNLVYYIPHAPDAKFFSRTPEDQIRVVGD